MMTRNCIESERFLLRVKIKGEPDVSTRAVARNIFRWAKTDNRKTLPTRFGCRIVLSKNQFGAHDRRETVWRRRSGLSSIYMIRIWLQIGPDARNNAKQADDVVQDLGTSRKPAAFDNADGPIWTVGEKGFLHHPKKFQEVARPTKAFFRASLT